MSEQTETVTMYYYFDRQGKQVWTSNETLALMRAKEYDSEVFRVEQPVDKKK